MADILSTSSITSLVNSYINSETSKKVSPLNTTKAKYSSQSSVISNLLNKLSSLKSQLTVFNSKDSDNVFGYKTATSSNSTYVSATADSKALPGSYELRVNQLAKKDIAMSAKFTSSDTNAVSEGTHTFRIVTGDGEGGQFVSNIDVALTGTETNKSVIEKIQNAINTDKAVVSGQYKTGTSAYSGGQTSFTLNINGTEKVISLDGTAATYSELLDQAVSQINDKVEGVVAEKIADPNDPTQFKLSLTVKDSSKYISVSHTSGYNLVSDLGIGVTKEKGASGIVSAASITPAQGFTQLSLTAKESGLDYRIMSLTDQGSSSALASAGMNLGSARASFSQADNTAGFVYADTTSDGNLLNAKFTLNGLQLQRNSNTVTDVATGVTLNLKSTMAAGDTTVNVAVANDTSSIQSKVESFISKFNDVYTYIKTNSSYSSGTRGVLYSDATASSIVTNFSSIATSTISGLSINSLSKIGITFSSSSGLTLSDSSLLASKINENAAEVTSLFNSDNGISTRLESFIKPYLGSAGHLSLKKSSIDNNAAKLADRIKKQQSRIDESAELLRARYEQLQAQLAQLYTTQSYFSTGYLS